MIYKIPLKNSENTVLLSADAYEYISNHKYLKEIKFLKNLRIHSNGYAFYQKNYKTKGGYKNETIYLHKLIAEYLVFKPEITTTTKLYVMFKNGNRLDCRSSNLEWSSRSFVSRNTKKTQNKTGFRGVSKERNKYRAAIYKEGKRYELGFYDSAEEAARAYNLKSKELFGKTKSLNKLELEKLKMTLV